MSKTTQVIRGIFFVGLLALNMSVEAAPLPNSFADVVEPLLPAVVNISTTSAIPKERIGSDMMPNLPENHPLQEFFRHFMEEQYSQRPRKSTALGSGFIIDPSGLIVTNNHIIADADEITVVLNNGEKTELKATIVGRDPRTDLALLKVEAKHKLPYLKWGNSNKARVGDWVIAIGNPFGLSSTVTTGIISTIARDISSKARNLAPADYINGYIQTDASINLGSSGGPMIDASGNVIGINTAILSTSGGSIGIGFAIPAATAKPVIEQLRQFGRTKRGWLGVFIEPVRDEFVETLKLQKPQGALVSKVVDDGPAAKAGIKVGDVILSFDSISVKESRHLPRIVGESKIGSKVPVEVWRDGKKITLTVLVSEFEHAADAGLIPSRDSKDQRQKVVSLLGLSIRELQKMDREKLSLGPKENGVVITRVKPYTKAFEQGIQPGDVILEADGKAVTTPKHVIQQIRDLRKKGKKHILLLLRTRNKMQRFVALELNFGKKKQAKKPPSEVQKSGQNK